MPCWAQDQAAAFLEEIQAPPSDLSSLVESSSHLQLASCDIVCPTPISASPQQNQFKRGFNLGFQTQYASLGTLQDEGTEIENTANQNVDSFLSQLVATYNFADNAGVTLHIPHISRSFRRVDEEPEAGNVSGLGDIRLVGRWNPIQKVNHKKKKALVWSVTGGVKLPTGDSSLLEEEEEEEEGFHGDDLGVIPPGELVPEARNAVHGHDLALGSGSVDALIGTNFYLRRDAFFLNLSANQVFRTRGDFDYQYGNASFWSISPGALISAGDTRNIGLQLNILGEHRDVDNVAGVVEDGTGVDTIYLGPEVSLSSKNFQVRLGVDIPLQNDARSFQLVVDRRVRGSFNWRF